MKLNFFARIYLAITDFRLYPFVVQKEKFIHALLYFLGFILLVTAILSTGVTVKILNWLNDCMLIYNDQVPDFVIEDGEIDLSNNMNFSFDDVLVYGDDSLLLRDVETKLDDIDLKENYVVLVLKNGVALGSKEHGYLGIEYGNLETNKQEVFLATSYALQSVVFKLSLAVAILLGVFFAYLIIKLFNVLFVSIALLFLGLVFRTKHKFVDYIKVAFYVMTLPIITEIIALMVIGEINEYASITYFLLMWVYMYYAIRALKLDNIIMSTQQKIMGMKISNIPQNDDITSDKKENNMDNNEEKEDKENKEDNKDNDNKN